MFQQMDKSVHMRNLRLMKITRVTHALFTEQLTKSSSPPYSPTPSFLLHDIVTICE